MDMTVSVTGLLGDPAYSELASRVLETATGFPVSKTLFLVLTEESDFSVM